MSIKRKTIFRIIRKNDGPMSKTAIAKEIGCSKENKTLKNQLETMEKLNYISVDDEKKHYTTYSAMGRLKDVKETVTV
jgi:DNA-binding IclR family transcriptional regulator